MEKTGEQMKVTILGTGTFYVSKERSGPAYLLEADGKKILIDCGPGTLIRLSQIGVKPEDLDYIFITHFHADHTTDLFALQMNLRLNEFFGTENIENFPTIYGPEGIKEFTRNLSRIYQLPAFDNWEEIKYEEYSSPFSLGGVDISAFKVDHTAFGKNADAYALRFEFGGKVFAFSGDSVSHPGLKETSENADLFICDASYTKGKGSPAHMDTWDIGELSDQSQVKKVILTHFYPNTEDVDLVSEVKEKYSGEVVRGEDLMEIEI